MRRAWPAALMAAWVLAGCSTVPRTFVPADPLPEREFSHELLDGVLRDHVVDGWVDYPSIQSDPRLPQYLVQLDRVDPNSLATRDDRLAFWINTYNALAIKGIVDRYSPETLWGRYKYFLAREYPVGGRHLTLDGIESQVLIAQFRDPRIHFAIVCASRSCPKLQSWVYDGKRLGQQLDQVARAFVNDPVRNRFHRAGKTVYLSQIFAWFAEDFEREAGSLLGYVRRYVNDRDLERELETTPYRIEFLRYDWSLNGFAPHGEPHARASR
ncbi:MAG: hypothetical protein NBKEAIPA_01245 [Nitrospirae bacterium]|nr:MAG: hypothetical protein UZ03_NOB001001618 [Nitrospira sp. OLB3]MBV6469354.1 hypothetical protein [Nitrospirota bacterium]MCE7966515.1 DUF547 domain-containing protein [Nitrospira sp. NTP2]RIK57053.1 MAG: hypothetical protein DCC63_15345 [Nitrospira sp.]